MPNRTASLVATLTSPLQVLIAKTPESLLPLPFFLSAILESATKTYSSFADRAKFSPLLRRSAPKHFHHAT